MSTEHFDIVIVGAGLVGASLACAIAQHEITANLRIALIDASHEHHEFSGTDFDPRVVALTQASQQLLTRINIWQEINNQRACAYREMEVWDGEGNAHIHFNCAEVQRDYLGHIVENSVVVNALHKKIMQQNNVRFMHPLKITALHYSAFGGVTVGMDNGEEMTAQLLIAADGAHSAVRELAEFETREWEYGHKAIITTVQTEQPHQFTAWQRFMRTGPLAFLPLPTIADKYFCSIVWSAETTLADELMCLDDAEFCARLAHAFEYKLGNIIHTAQRFVIPLRQRHAKTYIKPCVVLVGDAAHNIHPLAGQGVNLGLLDVAALTEEIVRAIERKIPLGDVSILRRYQRARLTENLVMMSVMEGFKRLFGSHSLAVSWLRNAGMRQLDSLTELKKIIIRAAMGID